MKICSITLNITVFTKPKDSTNCCEIKQYLGQRKWLQLKFPPGQCVINRILPTYYENSGVLPFPLHLQCLTAIFKCLYQCYYIPVKLQFYMLTFKSLVYCRY